MILSFVLGLFLLAGPGRAASMNVHSVVAQRALDYFGGVPAGASRPRGAVFEEAIRAHPEAVTGGADFPDFVSVR